MLDPLNLVFLAADRIEEAIDDAVAHGRVSRDDANELVADLVGRGRDQTREVLGNLEQLLGKGIDQIETVSRRLEAVSAQARSVERLDALIETVRKAAIGASFPIEGYEGMSVPRVRARLSGLSEEELRTVRAYEVDHANRKSVLAAIDRALG